MGLRQSLDEGAGEIGDDIGEEMPSTPTELREELPAGIDELPADVAGPPLGDDSRETANDQAWTNDWTSEGSSIDAVVEDTPLDRFL